MGHYSTTWFLNYSNYKTRVICITHVSHTPKKLSLNKIISLHATQDLLVIVLLCISNVLITVTGGKIFFYTALFCLLLIYYNTSTKIINGKEKVKVILKVFILRSSFPVLWETNISDLAVTVINWCEKSNMQKFQHYF